jgi:hypothetical protein
MFLGLDDICKVDQVLARDKKSRFSRALWAVSEAERRTGAFARATRFTRATLEAVRDVSSPPASSPTAVAEAKKKDERRKSVHAGWWIEKSIRRFFGGRHLLLFDGRDQNLSRSGEAGARRAPTRGSG